MSEHERMMRAVCVRAPGAADQLYLGEAERPAAGPGEVLVRVRATALNRADVLQRRGHYPPPEGASAILGLEMAGEVVALGKGVTRHQEGDAVCALLPGGGYAQYAAVPEVLAMPVPRGLSFEEAAALPEVFLTAFQALHWIARLEAGERVLIHAGASGVGTAALQLARLAGATAYATASAGKHARCLALGATRAIDYRTEDFAAVIADVTDGRGVDVIVDFIGAPYFHQNLDALAVDGRVVLLAQMGGAKVEQVDLRPFFRKRAQLTASTLRNRSEAYKARLTRDFEAYALPHFAEGRLKPVIDRVMDWGDVAEAHRVMEANANAGKIVLRVD